MPPYLIVVPHHRENPQAVPDNLCSRYYVFSLKEILQCGQRCGFLVFWGERWSLVKLWPLLRLVRSGGWLLAGREEGETASDRSQNAPEPTP